MNKNSNSSISRNRASLLAILMAGICLALIISINQFAKASEPQTDCPHLPGRMTGGGLVITADGTRVTHGFELYCDPGNRPNNLEINFKGNRFHLETVDSSYCFDDPNIEGGHPNAAINTLVLSGTGRYNGVAGARVGISFTDAGEPGRNDEATIIILDANGNVVLNTSKYLTGGNHQAHNLN